MNLGRVLNPTNVLQYCQISRVQPPFPLVRLGTLELRMPSGRKPCERAHRMVLILAAGKLIQRCLEKSMQSLGSL